MARFGTRAIQGMELRPPAERPLSTPIWQTSTFAFDDAARYARALAQPRGGYVCTRYENPTTAALEALAAAGTGEGMVRMSVGLEDVADLREDLTQALEVA